MLAPKPRNHCCYDRTACELLLSRDYQISSCCTSCMYICGTNRCRLPPLRRLALPQPTLEVWQGNVRAVVVPVSHRAGIPSRPFGQ